MTVDQIVAKYADTSARIERTITISNLSYNEALDISTELERSGARIQNGVATDRTYYVRIEETPQN
jgi:hypothetical protein